MALPTLDATFASSADLPRKQMLAKWLVEELGETQAPSNVLVSGAGSSAANGTYTYRGEESGKPYYNLVGEPDSAYELSIVWNGSQWAITSLTADYFYYSAEDVEFPWLVEAWTLDAGSEPTPTVTEMPPQSPTIADYWTLPERYLWAKIAVAAGAPRGEADYISLPKNYAWSDIYNSVSGLIPPSNVLVAGLANNNLNGTYLYVGLENDRPRYELSNIYYIVWDGFQWTFDLDGDIISSTGDIAHPWLVNNWFSTDADVSNLALTEIPQQGPNRADWSENVALGHIAAAYRGDTGNPANLATYIDWPWRYKVASIIQAL